MLSFSRTNEAIYIFFLREKKIAMIDRLTRGWSGSDCLFRGTNGLTFYLLTDICALAIIYNFEKWELCALKYFFSPSHPSISNASAPLH